MQAGDVRLQVSVHLDLVGVELQLRAVQQRFGAGKAGHDLVHHLDELDDIDHGAVGHGSRDVTGHGVLQGRAHIGAGQLVGPCALAVQNITVALHQNVACAQHVRQLADLLRVGDGLVERLGEIVADENRKVGVVALLLLEAVAVDNSQIVVVVFLRDKAAGVLAEGAHLVAPRGRVADQLALIQDLVDLLHDLVAALNTDADVNGAGLVGNVVLGADLLQPVRAAAAGGNDDLLGQHIAGAVLLTQAHTLADRTLQNDVLALGVEEHLHTGSGQMVLDVEVELLGFLGAEVADGAVNQLQTGLNGALADVLDVGAFVYALNLRVGAEFQIDLIGVVDQLLREILAYQVGQFAADLIGQRKLTVRECTRTGKAGRDGAGRLAVDADAGLVLGAVPLFHGLTLFDKQDLVGGAAFAQQLQCGENAGRAGAYDDQIIHGWGFSPLKITCEPSRGKQNKDKRSL